MSYHHVLYFDVLTFLFWYKFSKDDSKLPLTKYYTIKAKQNENKKFQNKWCT